MMKSIFSKHLLAIVVVVALLISGCSPKATQSELVILDWAGYEAPEYHSEFTDQHPDVDLKYTFFADDAEGYAKSKSGFTADLVHPCTNYWGLYVEEGLVQPIDTSRLKYWSGINEDLAVRGEFDGKQYFIPWDWGYESILVRPDLVETVPESWADLWNPEYAGYLSVYDAGENAYIFTALSLGLDPWNTTPEQNEVVKQRLLELKPNVFHYWSDYTELNQLVASGDIRVASGAWNDAYLVMLEEGIPAEYITPTEGRMAWVCGYGISSDIENIDLAYDYLDALMSPEANGTMANDFAYGPGNQDGLQYMDAELIDLLQLDDPAVLESAILPRPLTIEQHQIYTDLWVEIKAAP
jgi:spermidine/putrescine transport system substrate-binding protein